MKKRLILFLTLFVLGCTQEEYQLCPDGVTQVINLGDCPEEKPECPVCDDDNPCTSDLCSEMTEYECKFEEIRPCEGNNICEQGEFGLSEDCPNTCNDEDECTTDGFDYMSGTCMHTDILPCCGNSRCDSGETYVNCQLDCVQQFDVLVTTFQRMQKFQGSYYGDLTRSPNMYLLVEFKMKNIAIERDEELNFQPKKGFFYDPYKMRLEDDRGKIYTPEYDSDLLEGYLDTIIIEKGHTMGAALLFVIPQATSHARLIVYDKYGSKLDISEIY